MWVQEHTARESTCMRACAHARRVARQRGCTVCRLVCAAAPPPARSSARLPPGTSPACALGKVMRVHSWPAPAPASAPCSLLLRALHALRERMRWRCVDARQQHPTPLPSRTHAHYPAQHLLLHNPNPLRTRTGSARTSAWPGTRPRCRQSRQPRPQRRPPAAVGPSERWQAH